MGDKILITYVDDSLDSDISKYMETYSKESYQNVEKEYRERKVLIGDTYESLINDETISHSQILLIDSYLFSSSQKSDSRVYGERFKMVMNRYFPYTEVIVITQNDIDVDCVKKYSSRIESKTPSEYYAEELNDLLDKKCQLALERRNTMNQLRGEKNLDSSTKDFLLHSLNGDISYDYFDLKKLDDLIDSIKKLKDLYG